MAKAESERTYRLTLTSEEIHTLLSALAKDGQYQWDPRYEGKDADALYDRLWAIAAEPPDPELVGRAKQEWDTLQARKQREREALYVVSGER